jgi:hypothetical protein
LLKTAAHLLLLLLKLFQAGRFPLHPSLDLPLLPHCLLLLLTMWVQEMQTSPAQQQQQRSAALAAAHGPSCQMAALVLLLLLLTGCGPGPQQQQRSRRRRHPTPCHLLRQLLPPLLLPLLPGQSRADGSLLLPAAVLRQGLHRSWACGHHCCAGHHLQADTRALRGK